ncbi:MAG: helix-turn-helix transcriptional regulator [Thermodesulfovibrionales bacterium]
MDNLVKFDNGNPVFFEESPDGMLLVDTTGRIVQFNEAAHRQLGYSREEFGRLGICDIDPFESDEGIRAKVRKVLDEGKAEFEVRQKTKGGNLRDVHVDTQVISLSGRTVFYTIWRDVTDFKRSGESLRDAMKQVDDEKIGAEAVIAAMGNAVGMLSKDFRVLYQNPASIELVGNHAGEYCYSAFEGKNAICEGCPVAASFKDGKIHTSVRRLETGRGVSYFENTASVVRDSEGKIVAAVEVCRDITEHKRAEDELLQRLDAFQHPAEELISAIRKVYDSGKHKSSSLSIPFGVDRRRNREIPPLLNLSLREYQVLCMIGSGKRIKEIAEELSVNPSTVATHRSRILAKMHLKSSAELVRFFIENRLASWAYDEIKTKGK